MSVINTYKSPVFKKLNVEFYNSALEMASDLQTRKKTSSSFDEEFKDRHWVGASREEAYEMLRSGYQPTVDALKDKIKVTATEKRFRIYDDVTGFIPIVPNAIIGLPKSMVNSSMKPIKMKVLDVYYDMTASCSVDSDDLIKAGQKMLGVILEMEAQGYRFNLYSTQNYYDSSNGADMVCVKIKSANQPFDLKRMSFPTSHTAFFRGIGFEWYSKFPLGTYRFGYGHSVAYDNDNDTVQDEFKRLFGRNAIFFSAATIIKEGDDADEYIRKVLSGKRHDE